LEKQHSHIPEISYLLLQWYEKNKRDLPWRKTSDPYTIWISEIILQQTRVNQGYDYFLRFTDRFPDVKTLAEAPEDDVLKMWQGLGYYSRARNLHHAAKDIVSRFKGLFPDNYKDNLSLKGVGEYTAAAIASISFGLPYAVVDGNVFRVLSRLFKIEEPIDSGTGKKLFYSLAQELLDKTNPGTHNQAVMELGSLQCTPGNPDCMACPVHNHCMAFAGKTVAKYPVKKGKTKTRNRYFNYFDIKDGEYTYINKRTESDIWKNLYEYPLIETDENLPVEKMLNNDRFKELFGENNPLQIKLMWKTKHILSHQIIYANFYRIEMKDNSLVEKGFIKIPITHLDNYPVSRLVTKYLESINK